MGGTQACVSRPVGKLDRATLQTQQVQHRSPSVLYGHQSCLSRILHPGGELDRGLRSDNLDSDPITESLTVARSRTPLPWPGPFMWGTSSSQRSLGRFPPHLVGFELLATVGAEVHLNMVAAC